MIDKREAIQRLVLHEGFKDKPYRCTAGKLTIGVGRNIEDRGISRDEAYYMLSNDIRENEAQCMKRIPFFSNLDSERQYVLVDMAFMGMERLLGFKKMLAALGVGNYKEAAKELLDSKYAKQVGKRAERLAKCLETGVFKV